MKQGKIWGSTKAIKTNDSFEFHRIEAKKGAYCSKHKHVHKFNGFFVESGSLMIKAWKDTGLVDETILNAGEYTEIQPGEYHQFVALADTVAFELYWAEFKHDDIVRENRGGKK